ncbi:MAG: hypothetical protein FIB07_16640 [Candidatus Methanoperedens sp.]|nr:hypothetical protein [Candidatus Methanoperedens sp.]
MSIGLFLDVDDVLTQEPINIQLARLLGVEKDLQETETKFHNNKIDNDEFNRILIGLFRDKKLTQNFIKDNYSNFRMRIYHDELVRMCDNVHLLSSGPSYFIDILGQKLSIPQDRILCSKYIFDEQGVIFRCIRPVNSNMKARFVKQFSSNFDLTIGVGNNPEQDNPFLSNCDIKILMGEHRDGYIGIRDIGTLINLINILKGVGTRNPTPDVDKATYEGAKPKTGYYNK